MKLYEDGLVRKKLPQIPGITKKTGRFLKWKSAWYLITHDTNNVFLRTILRSPFRYLPRLFRSLIQKESYSRDGDFYLYGIDAKEDLQTDGIFVLGFSYCHKPFACPSGRFTDECIHDKKNPVCSTCFICQACDTAPKHTRLLFIPTIHYIGEKILELREQYPKEPISFLITACELTLKMFADWGNMADIKGIGVRLDGRICNTMRAFELSEHGVKPGLTVVLPETQRTVLRLLR